jgi:signal transduction histidine kinase
MAKETAHQLGTPVSSLEGWVEMLKESDLDPRTVQEIQKDVDRLKLVSDRFGKIGSKPQLEERDLVLQIRSMIEYIRKRATGKVQFILQGPGTASAIIAPNAPGIAPATHTIPPELGASFSPASGTPITGPAAPSPGSAAAPESAPQHLYARISGPLFDWVIENLLKNALDAMEGKGAITVTIQDLEKEILIDVADTGKGIAARNLQKVFKPGFTTKKRGWGLGLSLSRRIIEQYHKGQLFVRHSDLGKGTTFRIALRK